MTYGCNLGDKMLQKIERTQRSMENWMLGETKKLKFQLADHVHNMEGWTKKVLE